MGKKLIVKGADFSANGIKCAIDVSKLFVFRSTYVYVEGGTKEGEGDWAIDSLRNTGLGCCQVDLSEYVGSTIKIDMIEPIDPMIKKVFRCLTFKDTDSESATEIYNINYVIEGGSETFRVYKLTIPITDDNKIFCWTYLDARTQSQRNIPFQAIVYM